MKESLQVLFSLISVGETLWNAVETLNPVSSRAVACLPWPMRQPEILVSQNVRTAIVWIPSVMLPSILGGLMETSWPFAQGRSGGDSFSIAPFLEVPLEVTFLLHNMMPFYSIHFHWNCSASHCVRPVLVVTMEVGDSICDHYYLWPMLTYL